jgi:hypothetical protein
MGHILLGHGSLTPEGYSFQEGMDTVAVPPGTTLQFFADAGQGLVVTKDLLINWDSLEAPWPALTSDSVTYNLGIGAFKNNTDGFERYLAAAQGTQDHTIHVPGVLGDLKEDDLLCTGAPGDCPRDPREQRAHSCDGILARLTGDLYWIACTSLVLPKPSEEDGGMTEEEVSGMRAVVDAALGNRPHDAVLGADPDDLMAATLQLLDHYDTQIDFQAYFYVMLTPEQRTIVSQNDQVRDWLEANPL